MEENATRRTASPSTSSSTTKKKEKDKKVNRADIKPSRGTSSSEATGAGSGSPNGKSIESEIEAQREEQRKRRRERKRIERNRRALAEGLKADLLFDAEYNTLRNGWPRNYFAGKRTLRVRITCFWFS